MTGRAGMFDCDLGWESSKHERRYEHSPVPPPKVPRSACSGWDRSLGPTVARSAQRTATAVERDNRRHPMLYKAIAIALSALFIATVQISAASAGGCGH